MKEMMADGLWLMARVGAESVSPEPKRLWRIAYSQRGFLLDRSYKPLAVGQAHRPKPFRPATVSIHRKALCGATCGNGDDGFVVVRGGSPGAFRGESSRTCERCVGEWRDKRCARYP